MAWQYWFSIAAGAVAVLLWILARGFQKPVLNGVAFAVAGAGVGIGAVEALSNFMTPEAILYTTLAGLVGWFARGDYESRD